MQQKLRNETQKLFSGLCRCLVAQNAVLLKIAITYGKIFKSLHISTCVCEYMWEKMWCEFKLSHRIYPFPRNFYVFMELGTCLWLAVSSVDVEQLILWRTVTELSNRSLKADFFSQICVSNYASNWTTFHLMYFCWLLECRIWRTAPWNLEKFAVQSVVMMAMVMCVCTYLLAYSESSLRWFFQCPCLCV